MDLGKVGENQSSPQGMRIRPQNITIEDKKELYKCYLPFIKEGGLFIPFNDEVGPDNVYPGMTVLILLAASL